MTSKKSKLPKKKFKLIGLNSRVTDRHAQQLELKAQYHATNKSMDLLNTLCPSV